MRRNKNAHFIRLTIRYAICFSRRCMFLISIFGFLFSIHCLENVHCALDWINYYYCKRNKTSLPAHAQGEFIFHKDGGGFMAWQLFSILSRLRKNREFFLKWTKKQSRIKSECLLSTESRKRIEKLCLQSNVHLFFSFLHAFCSVRQRSREKIKKKLALKCHVVNNSN